MSGPRNAPVMVVSGGTEFLRLRIIRKIVQTARKNGRRLVTIKAGDESSLRDLFGGGFLFADATVAVVESAVQRKRAAKKKKDTAAEDTSGWSEEALALVLEHVRDGDSSDIILVIHHEGEAGPNTFAGQVAAVLPNPKKEHLITATHPWWKERDVAVAFLKSEMKDRGKSISEELAEQVIRKVGTELGFISFEAQKFSMCLDVDQRTEVTPQDAASLMASLGGEDWEALKSALGARNTKLLVRSWNDIRNGPGGDALPKAIGTLTGLIVKWAHAAALHEQGLNPEDAASRAGVHPYQYQNFILPAAIRWGRKPLEKLLRDVTMIGVRKGHINPWVALESTLVLACTEVR